MKSAEVRSLKLPPKETASFKQLEISGLQQGNTNALQLP